ncbi:MAG: sterol desaturase family protein [Caldilineaceae bacterium]|nr:sterol desaturase family protein [Caldilineaceae bacterium]
MADISAEREGLVDGMPRDARGNWQPEGAKLPNPIFAWPPKPMEVAKWLYNYLFPWNFIYMLIAVLTVVYLQPEMARMKTFSADWILFIFARNLIMLTVIVSAWHLWLWARKSQGFQFKYTPDWMAKGKKQFLAGNQLFDNIFWSCVSGGTIWTAYEVVTLWMYANEYIPYLDPRAHPVYFVLMLCAIQMWRLFHFYWTHRILHWPPLYKAGHYLHHRNINVGPWSGLSMHPIEHILYFSCAAIHWIIPSHPIHVVMNLQHAALTPAQGHAGFEAVVINGKYNLAGASYFHQLHHRYFECNYGEPDMPFDHWFGTSHDGSAEAHQEMRAKRFAQHKIRTSAT